MRKHPFLKLVLGIALVLTVLPMAVVLLWSVTRRWPWPLLLPESYTFRTVRELLTGSASLPKLLLSSIGLALTVAVLGDRWLPAVETVPAGKEFDYEAKYQKGGAVEL